MKWQLHRFRHCEESLAWGDEAISCYEYKRLPRRALHTLLAMTGYGALFISVVLTFILSACSESPVMLSGGGTDVGNGSEIAGSAVYPIDKKAANAAVRLRRSDYLVYISLTKRTADKVDTVTDDKGRFLLSDIDSGSYHIEVNDENGNAALLKKEVSGEVVEYEIPEAVLQPTAGISGRVELPDKGVSDIYILVYGMERRAKAEKDGSFIIEDMPGGVYTLRIISSSVDYVPLEFPDVRVESGKDVGIGTLVLPLAECGADCPSMPDQVRIPVTYYDFEASHPDFTSVYCKHQPAPGVFEDRLDTEGRPVYSGSGICGLERPGDWFEEGPLNTVYCDSLTLDRVPGTEAMYEFEDSWFFPLDGKPGETIKGADGLEHNYRFCMEAHAVFKYRGGEFFTYKSDDDMYVFINNRLVTDLGGAHPLLHGFVDLDNMKEELDLRRGNYYNFDLFYCDKASPRAQIRFNTGFDFAEEAPEGVRIATENYSVLSGTRILYKNDAPVTLISIIQRNEAREASCANIPLLRSSIVAGEWIFSGQKIGIDSQVIIDPADEVEGIHLLRVRHDGYEASLNVEIKQRRVASPVFSLSGYIHCDTPRVELSTATSGADIWFTRGRKDFDTAVWNRYEGGFVSAMGDTVRLRAVAVKEDWLQSAVTEEIFINEKLQPLEAIPSGADAQGNSITVKILGTKPHAPIFYSLDDTEFTDSTWTLYSDSTQPVIAPPDTLRAIIVKEGCRDSDVMVEVY